MTRYKIRNNVNRSVVVLILTLFGSYVFGFLSQVNIAMSGITSPDKLFRVAVIYIFLIILMLKLKNISLPNGLGIYLWPSIIYLFILFSHYLYASSDEINELRAKKELFRLAAMIFVFLLCAAESSKPIDHRFLLNVFVSLGIVIGLFSIWHSMSGEAERIQSFVGEYLRSGTSITDSNSLGALLNIGSMSGIAGYLISRNMLAKLVLYCSLILILIARFFTFSTGSFYSIIISLLAALFLLRKYDKKRIKSYVTLVITFGSIIAIIIASTGVYNTLFYRVFMSDDSIRRESINSRIEQHINFVELMNKEPQKVFIGYGTAELPGKIGMGLDLHNSYLRPLGVGGLLGFVCFNGIFLLCLRNFNIAMRQSEGEFRFVAIMFFSAFIGWSFQAATLPMDTSIIQWFFIIIGYLFMRSTTHNNNDIRQYYYKIKNF